MSTRRRLAPEQRRRLLVDAGARLFADRPYDAVLMEDVATAAGVSRALLYRHFPTKRELFAAVYEQASADLLVATELDPARPFAEQLAAGLDAHFDYFEANAHSVIAANRVLATDPTIQAIISGELGELRRRMLDVLGVDGQLREATSAVLMSWLTYVRVLTIDWLDNSSLTREQMRQVSVGALLGALEPLLGKPGHTPDSTG
ncbi:TetR/AcrR family transcriptional regulator [Nocardia cyriacigeorgica]|uniref:TetR/AcrR family transcriptional regulator n=1 Tax=Nocardia cyriacigeorgica TaxID=135487 RepID=UPI0018935479|nr:TetR/AcrR family transcriptional regulator [Nocardia cyriacigeorgica]MBF6097125.1 TetR/AcrR family transcriptional regulator [Nocardia cyriacigeorgica]MBF6158599.1 TetR/AcrR family transcriptional regulator [Nocardia cyriacigeorgica]MBF6197713.1 TetR/AcrR family transcriptional regulator [Nocardia cyriacigeorgica]MBF6517706.1 TetR/AcrR family transcriptional regulator [Nocardia cyriacigeorgica]